MNCRRAEQWLSMAMDGELPPKQEALLREHLAGCASCRALQEEWASLSRALKSGPAPEAQTAEAAWADVRRAIRLQQPQEREQEMPIWGWRLRWAVALLAVLLLGGALLLVVRQKPMGAGEMAGATPGGAGGPRPTSETVPSSGRATASGRAATEVEWVETSLPGATPMVYEDKESGFTVIWIVEANHNGKSHAGS